MKTIGITGGVGAGKSEVLGIIEKSCNCMVLKADDLAKDIQKKGYSCYVSLVDLLGCEVLGDDKEIDKKKMASMIFADEKLLRKVNEIIHPEVKGEILKRIYENREKGLVDYFFIEAALLIEDGYVDICDELWYIYAPEEIRRERLKKSRGYSDEKIDGIMANQLSEEVFRKYCKVIIDNSGDLAVTRNQIEKAIG